MRLLRTWISFLYGAAFMEILGNCHNSWDLAHSTLWTTTLCRIWLFGSNGYLHSQRHEQFAYSHGHIERQRSARWSFPNSVFTESPKMHASLSCIAQQNASRMFWTLAIGRTIIAPTARWLTKPPTSPWTHTLQCHSGYRQAEKPSTTHRLFETTMLSNGQLTDVSAAHHRCVFCGNTITPVN